VDFSRHAHDNSGVQPIPLSQRRGLIFPALAWSGFTSALASIIVGSQLQAGLGTFDALFAVILGNWILFVYSAAIGFAAGRWGLSSQLVLEVVFGRWGAAVPGLLLGSLVTGWFAFHIVLTTTILSAVWRLPVGSTLSVCIVGVLFAMPLITRVSRGFNLTALAYPAMALFAAIVIARQLAPQWAVLLDGPIRPIGGTLPFGTGVCIAFGTFVVSGTMTGDIVRYCRTGNEAVLATAIAFLLSNLPFLILGVLIAAAGVKVTALFAARDALSFVSLALVILANWTTCDACLGNASVTLKSAFPKLRWTFVAAAATLLGIGLAVADAVSAVFGWALFLAAIVPPIGGVIVADYYIVRVRVGFSRARVASVNRAALLAIAAGIAAAFMVRRYAPELVTPLIGAPVAAGVYLLLAIAAPSRLGTDLGVAHGAQALD
jgi:cytosine permease